MRRVAPLEILRVDLESGLKLLGCASIAELDRLTHWVPVSGV